MNKIKQFFENDEYKQDPVMCRKLQIYPLDGLSIRVMGVESTGRRMTTYYKIDNEISLEDNFRLAIWEFLGASGLEK